MGEGDPIRPRLEQHASKKDFWTSCFTFTSKDENLNKAHVQYLESRLIALATAAKRCRLDNGNVPAMPPTPRGFLAEMLLCFPVLGLSVFSAAAPSAASAPSFYLSSRGVSATGTETPEGFIVRAGSAAAKGEVVPRPTGSGLWVLGSGTARLTSSLSGRSAEAAG